MIICHPLKTIFVKTKKVGGTSFEIALSRYCSADCIITKISPADERLRAQLGYRGAQNFDFSGRRSRFRFWQKNRGFRGTFRNHIESDKIKKQVPGSIWDSYTKIAIHRNPFEVLVSKYFWSQRNVDEAERLPFARWVLESPKKALINAQIAPITGDFAVDRVIRYSHLEEDINALGIEGLWETFSSIKAKGNVRPKDKGAFAAMYQGQADLIDTVCELCAEEIEHFNWEVPAS